MVSLGTIFSSFWILANNSWMQVPIGHTIVDGKIIPSDWRAILLGPIQMVGGAAVPEASLSFLFWGAGVFVLPVIAIYTAVVYWMFRGKLRRGYG